MAEKESRLNLRVTATDEASPVFRELARLADEIARPFQTASESIEKSFSNIAKSSMTSEEETAKSMNLMRESITGLASSVDRMANEIGQSLAKAARASEEHGGTVAKSMQYMDAQFAGDTIKNAGESITGFFESAISSAVDFDQAIVNTAASLNSNLPTGIRLASDEIEKMQQKALDLGQSGFFSANQIGEAMNTLAKQGIDYQTIMGGAIETVSAVAAANQADLESTANVVSDIIHEMGDSLQHEFGDDLKAQLTGVGDAMTSALHHARISMDDFLNTMKYVGPQASAMGLSIKDTSAAIALLGEHGIRGSQAGTTLRRMLTNLTPVSKQATAAMQDLGMITADGANIFFDAAGKMKPLTEVQELLHEKISKLTPEMQEMALKTIFGQYALSGMTAIANTAPKSFDELVGAMGKVGVTTDIVAEKSKGWGIEVQALQAHFATFMKDIGDRFKPVIESIMHVLNRLMEAWKGLADPVKNALVIFGVASGVLLVVGGGILHLIGTIGMLTVALGALDIALGPVLLVFAAIVAAVALVVAVVILAKKAWESNFLGIRDITLSVWNAIKETTAAVWAYIGPTIMGAVRAVSAFWNEVWPRIKELFNEVWHAMLIVLTPILSMIYISISSVLGFIRGAWGDAWNVIKDIFKGAWDRIVDILRIAWDIVTGIFKIALDILTGHWGDAWEHLVEMLKNIWGDIKLLFGHLVDDAMSFGRDFVMMMAHGISGAAHAVVDAVKNIADKIKAFLGFHSPTEEGPAADSDKWAPNFMNMFANGMNEGIPGIQDAATRTGDAIKDGISAGANAAVESVKAAVNQTQQIMSQIDAIKKANGGAISQDTIDSMRWNRAAAGTGNESLVNSAEGRAGINSYIQDQFERLKSAAKASGSHEDVGILMDKARANADMLLGGKTPMYQVSNPVGAKTQSITVNVSGAGKDGHQIGSDIAGALRNQLSFAL